MPVCVHVRTYQDRVALLSFLVPASEAVRDMTQRPAILLRTEELGMTDP